MHLLDKYNTSHIATHTHSHILLSQYFHAMFGSSHLPFDSVRLLSGSVCVCVCVFKDPVVPVIIIYDRKLQRIN